MRTETATPGVLPRSPIMSPFALLADTQSAGLAGADGMGNTYPTPLRATVSRAALKEATSPLAQDADKRPAVGFIGAGALATTLAVALSAVGWKVDAVASRSYASALRLARLIPGCSAESEPQTVVGRCRIVFLTVPDDVIAQMASSLDWLANWGVVHCSGAGTTELLSPAATAGALCGSFHPLQTFTPLPMNENASVLAAVAQARLEGVTFAVEGKGWLRNTLDAMASDLGGGTIEVEPADRPLYHASAVMSCGALVALLRSAAALWQKMGVDEETALRAIIPLARTTLENAAVLGPEVAATGPVVRGDVATLRRHLEALKVRAPEFLSLYIALTRASIPLTSALDRQKLRELDCLLTEFEEAARPRTPVGFHALQKMQELSASGRKHNDGGRSHG